MSLYCPVLATNKGQAKKPEPEWGAPTSMKGGEIHLTESLLEGGVQSAESFFKYSLQSAVLKVLPAEPF